VDKNTRKGCLTVAVVAIVCLSGCWGCRKVNEWKINRWHDEQISKIDTVAFAKLIDRPGWIVLCEKRMCGRYDNQFYFTEASIALFDEKEGPSYSDYLIIYDIKNKKTSWHEDLRNLPSKDELSKMEWRDYYEADFALEEYTIKHINPYFDFLNPPPLTGK
jgi:hypothetical protein